MRIFDATDVRLLARSLCKRPLFALLTASTLAAGVGATAATFTYVGYLSGWDNVTPDPDGVFVVRYTLADEKLPQPIGYLDFLDFRREASSVGEVVAWWIWGQGVRIDEETAVWAWGHAVSDGYLDTLGARPASGRLLVADDHRDGAPRAAVLGHRFWRRHYDAAPAAIGRTLDIGGQSYTIVGVTREGFIGTGVPADVYTPMQYTRDGAPEWDGAARDPKQVWGGRVWAMVRVAAGATVLEAQERLRAIGGELDRSRPLEQRARELEFGTYYDEFFQGQINRGYRMLAAAAVLLVLANVNVASLLVARYLERRRDISVLAALGATTSRICGLLVAEGLLLSFLGGALGILFSRGLVAIERRIMVTANPIDLGRWGEGAESSILMLDWRVVAFAFAVSLVTTAIFGLLPALHAARADLSSGLRVMSGGADRTTGRARRALVAAQVALAVTLTAGAGLLIRSFQNLADVDPGFQTARLAVAVLASANEGAGEPDLRADFEALRERAAAISGVESATLTDSLPLWGFRSNRVKSPADGEEVDVVRQVVGPGYFETMRQPVLRGRGIAAADTAEAPLAVVVNQELARRFWPDSDPVGRTLEIELLGVAGEARVIGVAADALQDLKAPPRPQLYLAGAQVPRTRMSVIMRTALDPDALLGTIERDLSSVSPRLAMINVATFERHLLNSLFEERTSASVGGLTALLGLLLAAAGTWSVLTYVARSRRRETAVRIALGATRRDIVGRILREAAGPVAAGAGAGAALTMASTRLLRAQLFGVEALDPATIVSAAAVVTACAALAALGPSLRASGIDPVVALRED